MPWPTKVQLHDSNYSHSYDGSEIIETWYIEPYSAVTAFVAACLGEVRTPRMNGAVMVPDRTDPARHFLYGWCYATEANVVPYDPRSFSYMGTANLNREEGANKDGNITRIKTALQTPIDPVKDIHYEIMPDANNKYSAGAFVAVNYKPVFDQPGKSTEVIETWDFINLTFKPAIRTNTINAGLKLYCPPGAWVNPLAGLAAPLFPGGPQLVGEAIKFLGSLLPDAGIAPVLKEEYQQVAIERRMLHPRFKIKELSKYINHTNAKDISIGIDSPITFKKGTLRFNSFDSNWVRVPKVNAAGDPDGFCEWLDIKLQLDWRTVYSNFGVIDHAAEVDDNLAPVEGLPVYNGKATLDAPREQIGWNHVLAYPGMLHSPDGLAWYRAKFSTNMLPVIPAGGFFGALPKNDCDPYPMALDLDNIWTLHW